MKQKILEVETRQHALKRKRQLVYFNINLI